MRKEELNDLLKIYEYKLLSFLKNKETYQNITWTKDKILNKEVLSVFEADGTISDKKVTILQEQPSEYLNLEFEMKIITDNEFYITKILTLKGEIQHYNLEGQEDVKIEIKNINIEYFGNCNKVKTKIINNYEDKNPNTGIGLKIKDNNNKENKSLIELFNISKELTNLLKKK